MDASSLTSATADVDLNGDAAPLQVDISDALSEKDKVKFTVHTRYDLTPALNWPDNVLISQDWTP